MQATEFQYSGSELELFEKAHNWKNYMASQLNPFISGKVLEVGTGIGAFIPWLLNSNVQHWQCLEPDSHFSEVLQKKYSKEIASGKLSVRAGNLSQTSDIGDFDTILYLDVLEHIEDDRSELEISYQKLKPGGHIVVLAPALQFLYNDFDKAIGHYRRYSQKTLLQVAPKNSTLRTVKYFDSAGFVLSLGNKWILKKAQPNIQQIMFWDKVVVPVSKVIDKLIGNRFGKNIVAVWQKPNVQ